MILLSHPTGNRNVREALAALDEAGLLAEFATTVAWRGGPIQALLPPKLRITAERRRYAEAIQAKTRTHPFREAARLLAGSKLRGPLVAHEVGALSIDAVIREHDAWTARRLSRVAGLTAVYAYEDGALDTFKEAKKLGLKCIYEHPVGYWREVARTFEEERELQPAYAGVLYGLTDSQAKRDRKDEEIGLADRIIVASRYSERSLGQFPGAIAPMAVISYGSPGDCVDSASRPGGRLRVMFVGSLQQRKGISYFVDAIRACGELVDTTVIGARVGDCEPLDQFLTEVHWVPSTPYENVLEMMRASDVLVLPSLSEGFGLVVLEAMSQGLTVVVSEQTGAADVVTEGVTGFVVPIRSSEVIAGCLQTLAREPDRLMAMKEAALAEARTRTWAVYRAALVEAVRHWVGGM